MKEYLKYYLGCEAKITEVRNDCPDEPWAKVDYVIVLGAMFLYYVLKGFISVKPILRPLSSMKNSETLAYWKFTNGSRDEIHPFTAKSGNKLVKWSNDNGWGTTTASGEDMIVKDGKLFGNPTPAQFHYLLSKDFDLFGLIDNGEAIERVKSA